jgi:hypothetical protein
MHRLGWLFAIAVVILVIQVGKNSATPSVGVLSTDEMHISRMQLHADKNMPVMVIDNPF